MKKTVTENHNIRETAGENVAEELIAQQNPGAEFVIGTDDEPETKKADTEEAGGVQEQEMPQEPEAPEESEAAGETPPEENTKNKGRKVQSFSGTVVLTGAASYLDGGTRFLKNDPVKITDKNMYEHLLKTGLFVHF